MVNEDVKLANFMEEQNMLHDKYGYFFPVGTKILGKGVDGELEIKGYLEIGGDRYQTSKPTGNKKVKVNKKGKVK